MTTGGSDRNARGFLNLVVILLAAVVAGYLVFLWLN
jgi:hypothetical protein